MDSEGLIKNLCDNDSDQFILEGGACEFIDIDIPSALNYGARYVVMDVISYSGQPFTDLPECYVGWMMRGDVQSGEIFEPSTVKQKVDITTESKHCVPVIFDLKEREFIWADVSITGRNSFRENAQNTISQSVNIATIGKAIAEVKKTSLYDLFHLNTLARNGKLVDTKEEADISFDSVDADVTPFDVDEIVANYL